MKPSPISTTPMTWLGIHDMLWQLTGIQKEYAKSQGGKAAASPPAPTRRSLRKRKPVQALLQALDTREPSEVPEPPRKRAKKSKSNESEKATTLVAEQPGVSTEIEAGPAALSHTKSTTLPSPLEARGTADSTPSPLTISSSLPSDSQPLAKEDVALAGSSRVHSKDTASKKVSAPQTASRSSRRTRERSPSFSSGSSTAVSAAGSNPSKRARSSSSVSSTSTTVDAESGSKSKGKGKEKAIDIAEATEEETDDEAGKRSSKSNRTTTKETAPKSSRKQGGGSTKQSPEDTDKLEAAEAPRRVRRRSRVTSSRSRKARKS